MNASRHSAAALMATLPDRFDPRSRASGGMPDGLISGPGTGTSDSIPAALSDGEVVIPADDVRAFGAAQIMAMIRKGGKDLPKPKVQSGRVHAAAGGLIEDPAAVTRIGNSYSGGNVSGPITVNGQAPGGTVSTVDPFIPPAPPPAAAVQPATPAAQPAGGLSVIGTSRMPATAAERLAAPPVGSPVGGARPAAAAAMGTLPGTSWSSRLPNPASALTSAINSLSSRLAAPVPAPTAAPAAPSTDYADRNDAFNADASARTAASRQPRLGYAEGGLVREEDLRRLAQTEAQAAAADVIGRRPPVNMGPADVVPPQQLPRPAGAGALQPAGGSQLPAARTMLAEIPPGMGQRPPVNMGAADVVQPARLPASPGGPAAPVPAAVQPARPSMGARIAGAAGPAAALAGIAGAAQSFDDISSGRRDQFQRNMGVETPVGSVAADAARVLANVGDATTFGLAGRTGRGIASAAGGGSFVDGFTSAASGGPAPARAHPAEQPLVPQAGSGGGRGGGGNGAAATLAALPEDRSTPQIAQAGGAASSSVANNAGGYSGTARVDQAQRDSQHLQDLAAIRRRIDENNGQAPGLVVMDGASAEADRRAQFNEQANLRNAVNQGSWSPRHGFQGNDAAVAAAMAPINARAALAQTTAKQASETDRARLQERGLDARSRMSDLRQQQAVQIDRQRLGLEGQRLTLDANRDDRAAASATTEQAQKARVAQLDSLILSGTPAQQKTAAAQKAALMGKGLDEAGKTLAGPVLKQLQEARDNATTISSLARSFKDDFAGKGVFGHGADAQLNASAIVGKDKDSVDWWKNYRKQAELVERHALFGASLTPGEQDSWRSADIGPGLDKEVIRKNLQTRAALAQRVLGNTQQDLIDAGHSAERVNAIAGRNAVQLEPAPGAAVPPQVAELQRRAANNPALAAALRQRGY